MAREGLRDELAGIVEASAAAGALVLTGGSTPDEAGAWYEPTVVSADASSGAPVLREETFGPVAAIVRAAEEAAAVELANDSPFGLGSSVWTENLERAEELSADIEGAWCSSMP